MVTGGRQGERDAAPPGGDPAPRLLLRLRRAARMPLPPGPRMSERCRPRRYRARGPFICAPAAIGDVFTLRVATEPPWVVLAHPDACARSSPAILGPPRRQGERRPTARPRPARRCSCSTGPAHLRQRKLMLRPSPARAWPPTGDVGRMPGARRRLAARRRAYARPAAPGDHARRRAARDLRRRARRAPSSTSCRARARLMDERIMGRPRCSACSALGPRCSDAVRRLKLDPQAR